MDYSYSDLQSEIREEHEARLGRDGIVPKSWLVVAVMARHQEEVSSFYRYTSQCHVSDSVNRYFTGLKKQEMTLGAGRQLVIEGFDYLQRFYVIDRDGESVSVVTDRLSDDELLAKAEEHEAQSAGHLAHAREIRRFVRERQAKQGAA